MHMGATRTNMTAQTPETGATIDWLGPQRRHPGNSRHFSRILRIHAVLAVDDVLQTPSPTIMTSTGNIFRLKAGCNNYDWGKKGNKSLVARYLENATGEPAKVEEDKPYAEVRNSDVGQCI